MGTCRECGQQITFRWFEGCVRPFHAYGMPCGEALPFSDETLKGAIHTRCKKCSQMVWLVRHNGGSVWVDELGWPWPKHPCFERDANQALANPVYEDYDRIARFTKRCEFCSATIKFSRYADHVERCSQRGKSNSKPGVASGAHELDGIKAYRVAYRKNSAQRTPARSTKTATTSDRQVLTRCEFCKAMLKPSRYAHHLRKAHSKTVAVPGAPATGQG